ncbi:MAG: DUF6261 family protein, partial [Dysgonamonadaceae bacterium]|nr:DUF6261 family protein [Dysgonamonadaceae bacterium]
VNVLRINDWLTQLNIENQKFKDLMTDRYEEASKRPTFRMKTARKETDKALHSIFEQVEALATVNGAGDYEAFIKELNAVLERYKLIQAQEKGRRKAKNN